MRAGYYTSPPARLAQKCAVKTENTCTFTPYPPDPPPPLRPELPIWLTLHLVRHSRRKSRRKQAEDIAVAAVSLGNVRHHQLLHAVKLVYVIQYVLRHAARSCTDCNKIKATMTARKEKSKMGIRSAFPKKSRAREYGKVRRSITYLSEQPLDPSSFIPQSRTKGAPDRIRQSAKSGASTCSACNHVLERKREKGEGT